MINDKNRIYDGWLSLEGGVDAGRAGELLPPNQAESAINLTFRGGNAMTRPGFRRPTEVFIPIRLQPVVYASSVLGHIAGEYGVFSRVTANVTTNVLTATADHGLHAGNTVQFASSNRLPAPLNPYDAIPPLVSTYYVVGDDSLTDREFTVSATPGGAAVNITDAGSGIHTLIPYYFKDQFSEAIYRTGKFQCAIGYSPHHGQDCIMALIGGRLFRIIPGGNPIKEGNRITVPGPQTAHVSEVVPDDGDLPKFRNNKNRPIAYMVQADKWLIAQDGDSRPIIYDGNTARRTILTNDPDKTEVPIGTIMAYGMGRLVVIVNDKDVAFGDLLGSHDLPDPADSLIRFTERNFLSEGFDAAIPFWQGTPTGMKFFPQLDTSTGNGQLMVFAERGATSFFLSLPREEWKTSAFQVLSLLTTGLRGHRSISVVNEDLWFRSDDGIRSFRQARSDPQGYAHIPLSTNVKQYLDNDADWLLKYASSIYFDNRVIVTTSPLWNNGRLFHWGMVVVDFDILSSFGVAAKPAWEGQWTMSSFVFPIQLLTGIFDGLTRAFLFAIDNTNKNQLFEFTKTDKDDWDNQRIEWQLVTRMFDFQKLSQQSTAFTENEIYDGDVWLKEIVE